MTIDKDQKKRLEVFSDVCKKAESFCPINSLTLFRLKDDVLGVYALGNAQGGGNGIAEIKLDVKSKAPEDDFVVDLQKLVSAIKKVRNDEVVLKVEKSKVVVENPVKTKNFVSVVTHPRRKSDEISETETMIDSALSGPVFSGGIRVKMNDVNRKILESFSELTRVLDVNDSVEVSSDAVRAADYLFIAKMEIDPDSISDRTFLFNRNVSTVLKQVDDMTVSADGKYHFLKMGPLGIRILFQPKTPRWDFPKEEDVPDLCPADDHRYVMNLKGADLISSVDQFSGMFDAQSCKYQQVKLDVSGGATFDVHFEDLATEMNEQVDCEFVENSTGLKDISIIVPTVHLTKMRDYLVDEKVGVFLNGKPIDETNGTAVLFRAGKLDLHVAKLLE